MKKLLIGCVVGSMMFTMTGCATTFIGEPKKEMKEKPSLNVVNNYYFIVIPEEKKLEADHRKQRGRTEKLSGGPRHRDEEPRKKTPGDPGARR